MTPAELIAWRSRMGWSVSEAARQLELSRNGYAAYERGFAVNDWSMRVPRPIPRHVELACERLEQITRGSAAPLGSMPAQTT